LYAWPCGFFEILISRQNFFVFIKIAIKFHLIRGISINNDNTMALRLQEKEAVLPKRSGYLFHADPSCAVSQFSR
jgi:hypothetical protein